MPLSGTRLLVARTKTNVVFVSKKAILRVIAPILGVLIRLVTLQMPLLMQGPTVTPLRSLLEPPFGGSVFFRNLHFGGCPISFQRGCCSSSSPGFPFRGLFCSPGCFSLACFGCFIFGLSFRGFFSSPGYF